MSGPLDGVTVLEVGSAIAGPFAGTILGDLGATVIKVERPSGAVQRLSQFDHDRGEHPKLTWRFLNLNRSKQSIGLDLKSEQGQAIFHDLVAESDAVIENMRPGVMAELGFGWESLQEEYPELVYCSVSGYGESGPYAAMPAVDTTVQGVSAFASQVGETGRPEGMNVFAIDITTAIYAAMSVLAALFEREYSGVGQRVDVSMLGAAVSFLGVQLGAYSAGQHHGFSPDYAKPFAPVGHYATADGYLSMMIGPGQWAAFTRLLGREEWTEDDHPYATPEGRLERDDELRADIEAVLGEDTMAEWIDRSTDIDTTLPMAPANNVESMVEDSQVRHTEAVTREDHHVYGEYYTHGIVPEFSRTPGEISDAPDLSENADDILRALGRTGDQIEVLRDEEVVR